MKILIVNKNDLSIASRYEDESPAQHKYGGPWGDSNQFVHIQCSEQFDWMCVKVVDNNGYLEVQVDEDLLAAKIENQWLAFREERNRRLAECDWTQVTDVPLIAQDKATWATYRQALRDLPENTEDPANPVWPEKPDAQI